MPGAARAAERAHRHARPGPPRRLVEPPDPSADQRRPVTDVHLAARAIEHQAELHSNDSDFARFSGLRWRNPVA